MLGRDGALFHDRFRVGARIGEGGMGTVWAARDERTGRDVALKALKGGSADLVRRLAREARIAQRLRHPNIVQVDEILTADEGATVLVMELLRGQSLRERLVKGGPLTLGAAAFVFDHVVRAVAAAHGVGIVHRDLKPENVFLHASEDGPVVKVLDFGIAKVAPDGELDTGNHTKSGAILGTPHYMAPEQVFGEGDVDGRADIWALGVILSEALSGRKPFDGENVGQIFKAITMGDPRRLTSVPSDVAELASAMVSRDRARRPSLARVSEVLGAYARAHELTCAAGARRPRAGQEDGGASEGRASRGTPLGWLQSDAPARRRLRVTLGAAVLAVFVTGGVVRMSAAGRDSPTALAAPPLADTPPAPSTASAPAARSAPETAERALDPDVASPPRSAEARLGTAVATAPAWGHRHQGDAVPNPRARSAPPPALAAPSPDATPARTDARLPGGVHGESPY